MSDPSAKRPKFRPNPKRQVILIVLAVLGLAAGYGLGYLFQPERGQAPPPADPTPARTSSPAPAEPASQKVDEHPDLVDVHVVHGDRSTRGV